MTNTEKSIFDYINKSRHGVGIDAIREHFYRENIQALEDAIRSLILQATIYHVGDRRLVTRKHLERAKRAKPCGVCNSTGKDPRYSSRYAYCPSCRGDGIIV